MKKMIGYFLRTSKEIKKQGTGYMFYACADSQGKGASTPMWITLIAEGQAADYIRNREEKVPPVINIAGEIISMGEQNQAAYCIVKLDTIEEAIGFSTGHIYMSLTDIAVGKDLWRNNENSFARTSAAVNLSDNTVWLDLKFFGGLLQYIDTLRIKKGAHLNILGELTELGVTSYNGQIKFNCSLNVPVVSRVNSKPYEPQPQTAQPTVQEMQPQVQVQQPTPQMQVQQPIPQAQAMPNVPIENVGNSGAPTFNEGNALEYLHKLGFV